MDSENKKLTDEEEALLREFEAERIKQKAQLDAEVKNEVRRELADEIKSVMEKEAAGAIKNDVEKAVNEEMDSQVRHEVETVVIDAEQMRREMETELRGKIEAETRVKLEEEFRKKIEVEARKRVEESRAEIEEKIRKEMEEKEKTRKEDILKKINVLKKMDDEKPDDEEAQTGAAKEEILRDIPGGQVKDKQLQEDEMKNRIREQLKKEMDEERARRKQDILKRLEAIDSKNNVAPTKPGDIVLNYNEMTSLILLFEESQKAFFNILVSKTDKKEAQSVFFKSVLSAEKKMPDVLKRVIIDRAGNLKHDGSPEAARIIANINAIDVNDAEKAKKLAAGLRVIFEERLNAAQSATTPEIKGIMTVQLADKIKSIVLKATCGKKVSDIFLSQVAARIK
jgi:hypothetical protein